MAQLSDLTPEIAVETPQCHRKQVERALQATLRHFCWETHFWQVDIPAITLLPFNEWSPQTYTYELEVPEGTEVLAVRFLVYEERELLMKSVDWLSEHLGPWRTMTGKPRYYFMLSDRRVRLVPASDKVEPIAVDGRVVLRPTRAAQTFGDDLMVYDQGLVSGALSRLLMMGRKPWTDLGRAKSCLAEYNEAVSQAKYEVIKDFSDGPEVRVQRSWLC